MPKTLRVLKFCSSCGFNVPFLIPDLEAKPATPILSFLRKLSEEALNMRYEADRMAKEFLEIPLAKVIRDYQSSIVETDLTEDRFLNALLEMNAFVEDSRIEHIMNGFVLASEEVKVRCRISIDTTDSESESPMISYLRKLSDAMLAVRYEADTKLKEYIIGPLEEVIDHAKNSKEQYVEYTEALSNKIPEKQMMGRTFSALDEFVDSVVEIQQFLTDSDINHITRGLAQAEKADIQLQEALYRDPTNPRNITTFRFSSKIVPK